ncbi:MAG: GTP-binding protein, partial [Kiritimatiellia bacterium]|nr:GTP-binding protein [Kiritimatiellia bacterium]
EQLNVVVVGHVDHGKSTLIGRLLADTKSLPQGKLEQVRAMCARNAKPFEYAFLLDALKDEQSQGITIDTARCFFKTEKRRYTVIDAPGHIEFLKNMITGASRADAAFIVIDAQEGIRENSRRHGYMVSMLGISQVSVLVNKMDLIGYREEIFNEIKREYTDFLGRLNVHPASFIPISAFQGENVAATSDLMPWYSGLTVLGQFDAFKKGDERASLPFRFPVQDIYKFTEGGDTRRIFAGTVETGKAGTDDEIVFLPSGKRSRISTIEEFNTPGRTTVGLGEAVGFTLQNQVYVKPGELMVKVSEAQPHVSSRFRANLFWMGHAPMIKDKKYKLKLGAFRAPMQLVEILNVIDASDLTSVANKQQVDRHDVAECVLETPRPVAFDLSGEIRFTGRFAIVDNHEIAGAGIVLEDIRSEDSALQRHVSDREFAWQSSGISSALRLAAYGHSAKFVVFTGEHQEKTESLATALEKHLFSRNFKTYYLRMGNVIKGLDVDIKHEAEVRDEHIRRLGELARILTDSGQIFITSLSNVDDYDLKTLELLNKPNEILVINVGENRFTHYQVALTLDIQADVANSLEKVAALLKEKKVILEYYL